jgi:hypothetical protein
MPQRNSSRRIALRLVLFTLAGWLLWAIGRDGDQSDVGKKAGETGPEPTRTRAKTSGFSKRRLATTLAFTTLFFAGAAFSAGAGDLVVGALEGSATCATEAEAPADEATPDEACTSAEESTEPEAPAEEEGSSEEATDPAPEPAPSGEEQSDEGADSGAAGGDEQSSDDQGGAEEPSSGDQGADPGASSGGDQSGQPAGNGGGSDGNDDGSLVNGDTGAGSGAAEDDEPDAGPGSSAHTGDDPAGAGDSSIGLSSEDDAAGDLEFDNETGYGVVWLHRTLPDPTPPAARLAPRFAETLARTATANHVDWALVLGVVRGTGHKSSVPATARQLSTLSARLSALHANSDPWRAVLALSGRSSLADRAVALSNYNRAVGLRGLVRGLVAETPTLERRVLSDRRLGIYSGGRDDIANHRINVRVLVLILYLAEAHGSVTVSSLNTGHRLYARPGVVSAHKYGLAVDIAALGGTSILGHQQAGGLTETAVRNILFLPVELKPKQVISLLGLGGPSFPLADHYDHIHVGY